MTVIAVHRRFYTGQSVWVSVAPDGSPIAVYLMLPGHNDAMLLHAAIPSSAAILELGCGGGRVSRHLVALGHSVTGVDNSDLMLAHASTLMAALARSWRRALVPGARYVRPRRL